MLNIKIFIKHTQHIVGKKKKNIEIQKHTQAKKHIQISISGKFDELYLFIYFFTFGL